MYQSGVVVSDSSTELRRKLNEAEEQIDELFNRDSLDMMCGDLIYMYLNMDQTVYPSNTTSNMFLPLANVGLQWALPSSSVFSGTVGELSSIVQIFNDGVADYLLFALPTSVKDTISGTLPTGEDEMMGYSVKGRLDLQVDMPNSGTALSTFSLVMYTEGAISGSWTQKFVVQTFVYQAATLQVVSIPFQTDFIRYLDTSKIAFGVQGTPAVSSQIDIKSMSIGDLTVTVKKRYTPNGYVYP